MYSGKNAKRVAFLASASVAALLISQPSFASTTEIVAGQTETDQQSVSEADILEVDEGGILSVSDDTAIKWNKASTDLQITNSGLIESTADDERAINAGGDDDVSRFLTLTNTATGIIQSQSDAIRINVDFNDGHIKLINAGTILSTKDGQAIDFDAISGTAPGQIEIINQVSGVIQSTDADAIRPGEGAVVTNEGMIYAGGVPGSSSDGIDFQGHAGTVNNMASGTISGARHGITSDSDVTVVNYGTILGRNGSGVGSDGSGTVINYGTITGAYDGSGNGDGDGIDIDDGGYIENYGLIQATGSAGVHDDGHPNGSDGATIGGIGGTIINHAGATIFSVGGAVPITQGTVINDGTITGNTVGVLFATGPGSLVNTGVITSAQIAAWGSESNDSFTNSGTISSPESAIIMGGGNDQLTLLPGSVLDGTVDGGDGTDQITLAGDGVGTFVAAANFEHLEVDSGIWALTGTSTFAGGTDVLGTLDVSGQLSSIVNVRDEGTLTGAGRIAGLNVASGGTVGIDEALGTLTVDGDATFAAGSTIHVKTTSNVAGDAIAIGGQALIEGGTLAIQSNDAQYAPRTAYAILTAAGGVSGEFDTITSDLQFAFLSPQIVYGDTQVDLILQPNDIRFADVAVTPNQVAVADAVQALGDLDPLRDTVLVQQTNGARAAYDALSGEIYGSVSTAMVDGDLRLRDTLIAAETGEQPGIHFWGQLVGDLGRLHQNDNAARTSFDQEGAAAGVDYASGSITFGAAGGYTRSGVDVTARTSSADVDTTFAGVSGRFDSGAWHAQIGGLYAWHDVSADRSVDYPGFTDLTHGDYNAGNIQGYGWLGYDLLKTTFITFGPIAGYDYLHLNTEALHESGGLAALDSDGSGRTVQFSTLGAQFKSRLSDDASPVTIEPRLNVMWQHGWGDLAGTFRGRFDNATSDFAVEGQGVARNSAQVSAGAGLIYGRMRFDAAYLGSFSSSSTEHGGRLMLSIAL